MPYTCTPRQEAGAEHTLTLPTSRAPENRSILHPPLDHLQFSTHSPPTAAPGQPPSSGPDPLLSLDYPAGRPITPFVALSVSRTPWRKPLRRRRRCCASRRSGPWHSSPRSSCSCSSARRAAAPAGRCARGRVTVAPLLLRGRRTAVTATGQRVRRSAAALTPRRPARRGTTTEPSVRCSSSYVQRVRSGRIELSSPPSRSSRFTAGRLSVAGLERKKQKVSRSSFS